MLRALLAEYDARHDAIVAAVTEEPGAPVSFSMKAQVRAGQEHMQAAIDALEVFEFQHHRGSTRIVKAGILGGEIVKGAGVARVKAGRGVAQGRHWRRPGCFARHRLDEAGRQ